MEYRYLGRSALKVSPLTLGSMMFGGPTDEATSHRIIARAHEQGINFIDTADVYHDGQSESVVGRAIQNNRHHWVLATKFGYSRAGQPNVGGQSRKWIIKSVEDSLRRLGTDYIDILYFHHATFDAPLGEGVRAIADLIRQGKLRHFGVSNFRGWRIGEVAQLADEQGIDRPVASQPLYNIVNRTAEVEQIPAANHFGLGVVTYSPLARGVLTGKYQPNAVPAADSRVGRSDKRVLETEWRPESLQVTQRIQEHLSGRDVTPADFALAWVLNNRQVTSAIAGPRTEEQWDQYQRALQVRITAEDEAFVNQLVSPGHTSTLGFTDPGHPVEGRAPR